MDRNILKVDRKEILNIHRYNKRTIIGKENECYGILYGNRFGPVIANNFDLAKDLYLKAYEMGAKSIVLVENTSAKKKMHDYLELHPVPNMDDWKMTYGKPLDQLVSKIYGLRSLAYG